MKRQPFLIVGELPDQSALSRFNNRKAKNLNNPINKAPDLKSRKSMDLDIPSDNSITSPTFLVVSLIMCALSIIVFARYIYVKKM